MKNINTGNRLIKNSAFQRFTEKYTPEYCQYILSSTENHAKALCLLLPDFDHKKNDVLNQLDFISQLLVLIPYANLLNAPVIFISKEPPLNNAHFIAGLFFDGYLVLMNPLGIPKNKYFSVLLEKLKATQLLRGIACTTTIFQKTEYENQLVSCGPLSSEFARHFASKSREEWEAFFTRCFPSFKESTCLTTELREIELLEMDLPKSINEIVNISLPEDYLQAVTKLRVQHWEHLATIESKEAERIFEGLPALRLFHLMSLGDVHGKRWNISDIPLSSEYPLLKASLQSSSPTPTLTTTALLSTPMTPEGLGHSHGIRDDIDYSANHQRLTDDEDGMENISPGERATRLSLRNRKEKHTTKKNGQPYYTENNLHQTTWNASNRGEHHTIRENSSENEALLDRSSGSSNSGCCNLV